MLSIHIVNPYFFLGGSRQAEDPLLLHIPHLPHLIIGEAFTLLLQFVRQLSVLGGKVEDQILSALTGLAAVVTGASPLPQSHFCPSTFHMGCHVALELL